MIRILMNIASGRIELQRIERQVVAFAQHVIDVVDGLGPVARGMARAERRDEYRTQRLLPFPPGPPLDKALGLAGQILERQLEGGEPPGQGQRADAAVFIDARRRAGGRLWGRVHGGHARIEGDDEEAGVVAAAAALVWEALARIEELKGNPVGPAFALEPRLLGACGGGRGRSRRNRKAPRTADSAGLSTRSTARCSLKGRRSSSSRIILNSAATMAMRAALLRSMALAQSKVCLLERTKDEHMCIGITCQGGLFRPRISSPARGRGGICAPRK
jgi:hypothetical protein